MSSIREVREVENITYAARIPDCQVLGPYRRAVLWVSGCCFDCEGCIALRFRKEKGTAISPGEMAGWLLSCEGIEGVTISGGEPFLQAEALAEMIRLVREKRDLGVIIYSGFTHEALLEKGEREAGVRDLLAVTDILIDGPYRKELDDNRPYVGSSNQRILLLTDRYRAVWGAYYLEKRGRDVQLLLSEKGTLLVGVPGEDQKSIWKELNARYEEEQNDGKISDR